METPVKNKFLLKTKSLISVPPSPLMKKLGYGTGVSVYLLERSPIANQSRSPWALKKLITHQKTNQEISKRLKKEADILRNLNHTNIVGFRALMKYPDGNFCLAMEECEKSLGDLIEERREAKMHLYPPTQIKKVVLDISSALTYLHEEAKLMHCDIKSYNILVKGDFMICKLCDFGVVLPVKSDGTLDKEKCTEDDEYVGSPAWTPPEIILGENPTCKSDIYAFGLTIWEMLQLEPPEPPEDDCESLIIRVRPAIPDYEYTSEYEPILQLYYCCTEDEPKNRPNAKDILDFISQQNAS